jgi:hypothetical protein
VSPVTIVLLVVLALLVALAIGGAIATARRTRASASGMRAEVERADHALAAAHAEDKGWDRERLEQAAHAAFAARHGAPGALTLVQVVDRPGTEGDRAVFRARVGGEEREVVLVRRGEGWAPEGG